MRASIVLILVVAGIASSAFSGCTYDKGAHDEYTPGTFHNPEVAGSLKSAPGLFPPPPRLSELPGSRVREGE
ncbi:MAG: hypothetical protein RLZZ233_976 [Verrucomicrobiota bacterium]|jgi:hypothetical protein